YLIEVAVDRHVTGRMSDLDLFAVVARPAALDHHPLRRGQHRFMTACRDVEPRVKGALSRKGIFAGTEAGIEKAANRSDRRGRRGDAGAAGKLRLEARQTRLDLGRSIVRVHGGRVAGDVGPAHSAVASGVRKARDDRQPSRPLLEGAELLGEAGKALGEFGG